MVDESLMFTMLNPGLNSVIYISRIKTLRRVLKSDKSSSANKKIEHGKTNNENVFIKNN